MINFHYAHRIIQTTKKVFYEQNDYVACCLPKSTATILLLHMFSICWHFYVKSNIGIYIWYISPALSRFRFISISTKLEPAYIILSLSYLLICGSEY